jgi:peroxiredoxin
MKNAHAQRSPARLTRAQRRAAERAETKAHRESHSPFGIPLATLIGGLVTLLVVAAIIVFSLQRSSSTTHAPGLPGLANPAKLSPAGALLPVGRVAPNFTLKDANGKTYSLASQRGHPVLLEFFAVWCPVCQSEAPVMAKLTKNYAPKGVRVFSVLSNPYGKNYEDSGTRDLTLATKEDLSWYAQTFNVRHPQLVDPTFATVNRYGISAYPGLYVVSKWGVISYTASGRRTYAQLSRQLDQAIKGAEVR